MVIPGRQGSRGLLNSILANIMKVLLNVRHNTKHLVLANVLAYLVPEVTPGSCLWVKGGL